MSEPSVVTVALSAGQQAEFRAFDQQEANAKAMLDTLPAIRTHSARAVLLATYTPEQIQHQQISIDLTAGTLTLALNALNGPALVTE